MKKTYRGWIALKTDGDADHVLSIGGTKESFLHEDDEFPWTNGISFAEQVKETMKKYGDLLTVRYYVSDKELPFEDVQKQYIMMVMGLGDATYNHRYSEITGYLWTDEELNVGGHDLLAELKSYSGRFIHLEIEFNKEKVNR